MSEGRGHAWRLSNEDGVEGSVMQATFSLNGQPFMGIDSPPIHDFTFTPSISFYVACDTEAEVDRLFARLSEGGRVYMPLAACPFNRRYGWVGDRFGVTWQLGLAES